MNKVNEEFADLVREIMSEGMDIETRNSKVRRITNYMITFDKTPLVSIRKTAWKLALREMEWFLSGSYNIKDLHESVRPWWKPWADEKGDVHNNYSDQFRNSVGSYYNVDREDNSFDQISYLIDGIKNHPFSRRNVITTWNTADMVHSSTPITNCHGTVIQVFGNSNDTIDMTMYQRSVDVMLGLPHNWIQYWAMLMYLAHKSDRKVGSFTWIGGDCHIYDCHFDFVEKMETIDVLDNEYLGPVSELVYKPTSEDFKADDFSLAGEYKPFFKEKLPMVV